MALEQAYERLKDLTAGWAEFVESVDPPHEDTVTHQEIFDLYQSVAVFEENYLNVSPEDQEQGVRLFVETHLMPLLLRPGKK